MIEAAESRVSAKDAFNITRINQRLAKNMMDRPTKLTPSVKLSDWDNPDLAWAMVRDDWPQ